jgi:hypothetical protein
VVLDWIIAITLAYPNPFLEVREEVDGPISTKILGWPKFTASKI